MGTCASYAGQSHKFKISETRNFITSDLMLYSRVSQLATGDQRFSNTKHKQAYCFINNVNNFYSKGLHRESVITQCTTCHLMITVAIRPLVTIRKSALANSRSVCASPSFIHRQTAQNHSGEGHQLKNEWLVTTNEIGLKLFLWAKQNKIITMQLDL